MRRRDLVLGPNRWMTSGLHSIRSMDRVPNARIRELCVMMKGVDERINEVVLLWRGWKRKGLLRIFKKKVWMSGKEENGAG